MLGFLEVLVSLNAQCGHQWVSKSRVTHLKPALPIHRGGTATPVPPSLADIDSMAKEVVARLEGALLGLRTTQTQGSPRHNSLCQAQHLHFVCDDHNPVLLAGAFAALATGSR